MRGLPLFLPLPLGVSFFLFFWGSPKGWQFFKVLDEQSLAIKLATPEIYNCQTLYAPFSANRYDGCVEKRPLRRSLVHNNKRGAVNGDHEEEEDEESGKLETRRQSCHCQEWET